MPLPLAYFLTTTYYGQRLHGDPRGSVDDSHNKRGTPYLPADETRHARELKLLKGPIIEFSQPMRNAAGSSIAQLCEERGWRLITQKIQTTHAHIIVNCRGRSGPERALADFKARITSDLRDLHLAAPDANLWTTGGSTRWLNHEAGLYAAIAYVNDWQTGPNRRILEEHKRQIQARIRELREWLKSQDLPESGHTVVIGESPEDRAKRVIDPSTRPG